MLFNGILCLVSAAILLLQIRKTQDRETSQVFQKFIWVYWAILMITGIHHTFIGFIDPQMNLFMAALDPLTDSLQALAGLVLSLYLFKRRHDRENLLAS